LQSPNVLLSEEGVAKIADVGMSRAQEAELVSAQPIMTPLWSAPEVGQVRGLGGVVEQKM
jgi:serine/threonine protein kinase